MKLSVWKVFMMSMQISEMNATLNLDAYESESHVLKQVNYGSIFIYMDSFETVSQNLENFIMYRYSVPDF